MRARFLDHRTRIGRVHGTREHPRSLAPRFVLALPVGTRTGRSKISPFGLLEQLPAGLLWLG